MDDTALENQENTSDKTTNISMLMDVVLQVTVVLGQTRMTLKEILDLQKGSVIELDRLAGDMVDVLVNNHMVARGEVVVVDDKFGVRITELLSVKTSIDGS
jgi:flagellar motor switch protein FliN